MPLMDIMSVEVTEVTETTTELCVYVPKDDDSSDVHAVYSAFSVRPTKVRIHYRHARNSSGLVRTWSVYRVSVIGPRVNKGGLGVERKISFTTSIHKLPEWIQALVDQHLPTNEPSPYTHQV